MTDYAKPEALVSTDWVLEHHRDEGVRIVEVDEDVLLAEFYRSATRTGFLQLIHNERLSRYTESVVHIGKTRVEGRGQMKTGFGNRVFTL